MSDPELLRLRGVINITQLSRSTIYAGIQAGIFPGPVKVSRRGVRWRSEDIDRWLSSLKSTAPVKGGSPQQDRSSFAKRVSDFGPSPRSAKE